MRLHLPEVMQAIEKKPLLMTPPIGEPFLPEPKDKFRAKFAALLMPQLHEAEKFIFDSGSDTDADSIAAVRETALTMLEAGFFHLPFPLIWIEDPFEDAIGEDFILGKGMRNYYLVRETDDQIRLFLFQSIPKQGPDSPRLIAHLAPLIIDKNDPSDHFKVEGVESQPASILTNTYGEAVYALKKFLVTLATEDIVREKVEGKPFKASIPKAFRQYPFSVVRVPLERNERGEAVTGADGRKRRKHLVRGSIWGKNTRPREEQRWIKPYWRGDQEVGVVERGATIVG